MNEYEPSIIVLNYCPTSVLQIHPIDFVHRNDEPSRLIQYYGSVGSSHSFFNVLNVIDVYILSHWAGNTFI